MNADDIYQQMEHLANAFGVELTKNAFNIARFRARADIPLEKCPCSPLDKERGCISKKCLNEIIKFGECHCRCYKRKE